MLFTSPYTPFSYIDYTVGSGGITTLTTAFNFPKQFLRLDHIKVYHKLASDLTTWNLVSSSLYTPSGTTGAGVITLGGGAPARSNNDQIRLIRVTPDTASGRLVDFQAGSIASVDLDTSALQDLYVAEEARDQVYAITSALQTLIPTIYGVGFSWQSV